MPDLIDRLVDAGIDARPYMRSPAGNTRAFVASVDPRPKAGRLYIYEGKSDIEVATNKRERQGVLNVAEQGREIVSTFSVEAYRRDKAGNAIGFLAEERIVESGVSRMRNAWGLPKGTHFEGKLRFMPKSLNRGSYAQVTVRAFAPASQTSLLVGMDETHHFVAQLPHFGVSSVAQAHRLLKPREAHKPGTKRQGEWFFVPVTDEDVLSVLMRRLSHVEFLALESNSTHQATVLRHRHSGRTHTYAIGSVVDTRKGRHAPLLLPAFHEVIRNREVVAPKAAAPERRYWD